MKTYFIGLTAAVALLLSTGAQAGLVSTAGGLGVYDNVNNVTWTSDANLMATQAASYSGGASAYVAAVIAASGGQINYIKREYNPYDTSPYGTYTLSARDFITSGIQPGSMSWWGAKAWVNYLNATSYAGNSTWALPTTYALTGSQSSSSQMGQLFYGGLGQVAGYSIATTHNSSYALFSQMEGYVYWSGSDNLAWDGYAAYFASVNGNGQGTAPKGLGLYALAVTPGDISAVPVPGAVWLLGSGLMGVLGLRRRTQRR